MSFTDTVTNNLPTLALRNPSMPEGHTLHRIARDHRKWFSRQKLSISSPQGRFRDQAKQIDGSLLVGTEAYGKHLFYSFTRSRYLHVHLGLYGKFRLHLNPPPEPQGAVRVRMVGKERSFDLNGPNTCELLDKSGFQSILNRLGPDPLRDDAEPNKAWEKIRRSRAPIGTLLLNQSVIAGLGNIYRAEILHMLEIHPERKGLDIEREEFDRIWQLSCELLKIGVRYNKIITVLAQDKPLSRVKASERLHIYKKSHCPRCPGVVDSWELGARTVYACGRCQT